MLLSPTPLPTPISFKSFHSTFALQNINDISSTYHVDISMFDPYLADLKKSRYSLLQFKNNFIREDSDEIHSGDIFLKINDQFIGCDTIKLTQILDTIPDDQKVKLQVLRYNQIKTLSVLPEVVVQEYPKKLELNDCFVCSNTPNFYLKNYKNKAPIHLPHRLLVSSNGSTIVPNSVYNAETEYGTTGYISKIGNTDVETFDDFARILQSEFVENKQRYFQITVMNEYKEIRDVYALDLTTFDDLEPKISFFDREQQKWKKSTLSEYVKNNLD